MATLVFVHAHPDDEASQTAGSMARAVAEGHRVVVVYATNGDHGDRPDDLAAGETLVDRRRVVILTQLLLLVATLILAGATLAGVIVPSSLLVLTFLVGVGFTFYMPAQQALEEFDAKGNETLRRFEATYAGKSL